MKQEKKICIDLLKYFYMISKSSIKVFEYIEKECIKQNKKTFVFNVYDAMKFTGYKTPKPIYGGLNGLMDHGIISKGPKVSHLWILNPSSNFK